MKNWILWEHTVWGLLVPALWSCWGFGSLKQSGQILGEDSHCIQNGMDAISPNETRSYPESLPIIFKAHIVDWTPEPVVKEWHVTKHVITGQTRQQRGPGLLICEVFINITSSLTIFMFIQNQWFQIWFSVTHSDLWNALHCGEGPRLFAAEIFPDFSTCCIPREWAKNNTLNTPENHLHAFSRILHIYIIVFMMYFIVRLIGLSQID